MARVTARAGSGAAAGPRLRRAYYDCRYGQLHLHNAIPGGGGFDELTSLVCVHGAGASGRQFTPLLAPLGADRSVYALDLPGCGESDPAPGVDFATAATHAILDFVESMRIRRFDLVASREGAAIARQVAAQRPDAVRRVATLDDPGAASAEDITALRAQLA